MGVMQRSRLTADVTLPREPKQERSRRKQTALLESARALFADPGFEHVTADDIAAHAGFGTGTFYNYFTNKTQAFVMVAGLHETAIAPTLAMVNEALQEGRSLHDIVHAIVLRVIEERRAVPWLRRTWLRLALTDPEVDAVQRRVDAEWGAAISEVVQTVAAQHGIDDPPAAPLPLAHAIRVLVDSLADEVVLGGTIEADEAASVAAAMIAGLLPAPAP
jgi:AcrR family transcriptional regulator